MKVVCPGCFKKARIAYSKAASDGGNLFHLFCSCVDVENCGATFTYVLDFGHFIKPPRARID
jgi:hypothetical protein